MPKNTANYLTIARVVMIPIFLVLMYLNFPGSHYWALAVYIIACLTDLADGYIARHYHQISDFGKFIICRFNFYLRNHGKYHCRYN